MMFSRTALRVVEEFESFQSSPYVCPAGKLTVGFGHVILQGETFAAPITIEQARAILAKDMEIAAAAIDRFVKIGLTDYQYGALAAFVMNVGSENFRTSTLLRKLNTGDLGGACAEFDRWVNAAGKKLGGLVRRRNAEQDLFDDGVLNQSQGQW